ncbi:uncharacterized protein FTOL_08116 [Fusarium torulosum]|uniref:Uncharacterized protein n=1 Tax=Fusarium torulosum TaxID=33205 RepID=A0AAE8MC80_9HYPO|nr:uncharacterized protein FTOL_08116 [Fusarium torulosum]
MLQSLTGLEQPGPHCISKELTLLPSRRDLLKMAYLRSGVLIPPVICIVSLSGNNAVFQVSMAKWYLIEYVWDTEAGQLAQFAGCPYEEYMLYVSPIYDGFMSVRSTSWLPAVRFSLTDLPANQI